MDLRPETGDRGPIASSDVLRREVAGFRYLTSPAAFFQANDLLVADLVGTVRELARGSRSRSALDLYCGVGLFSMPLARQYSSVTAVESSALACELCGRNAADAGLSNIRVVCADVDRWASAVSSVAAPGFDLVLLDPPRTGAGAELMSRLAEWAPETLIYVSCDPQTLARDLAVLPSRDYRIEVVVGLDMFPQTFHFETVVKLQRR
jgi:23S rRNA (uracil1939-C5)-methyltransferase